MRTTTRTLVDDRLYARARAQRYYTWARRNGQALLAAAVALGILLMILHWR